MVDVGGKPDVIRIASATGKIKLSKNTLNLIKAGKIEKGDPLSTAQIAAILAAKRTPTLIPLCHPIPITNVNVETKFEDDGIRVDVTVKAVAKTGVEMEAITAVALALITIWDMTKKYEKNQMGLYPHTEITEIRVTEKIKGAKA